jgi:hypothetical protein
MDLQSELFRQRRQFLKQLGLGGTAGAVGPLSEKDDPDRTGEALEDLEKLGLCLFVENAFTLSFGRRTSPAPID